MQTVLTGLLCFFGDHGAGYGKLLYLRKTCQGLEQVFIILH